MARYLPSFMLGFHGCDREVAERVFAGNDDLRPSENDYDWLGHGIYFWEGNPARALEFAALLKKHPRRGRASAIKDPAVIGAVIDPGHCLNLMDSEFLHVVKGTYDVFAETLRESGQQVPVNRPLRGSADLLLRDLDCAVIEFIHKLREQESVRPFDTVRGVFIEGEPLYPNAGFHENNHIQICVRNPECIVGYFRPRGSF
jgi:hypothetical protein